ncbi:hypothetical protein [Actinacidiphila alni]|uniref:hypothetical protein n=1 Tax=Actinacidiphila alni TaxID=380248 RepID=UPI0034553575
MNRRLAAVGTGALLLTASVLVACDNVDRALDCAKTAASIAGDVQDLQNSATNIGQVSDANRRHDTRAALDKVQRDLKNLNTDNAKVSKAVDDLDTAVRNARTAADDGRTPDLTPIGTAASHLTVTCAHG